LKLRNNSSLQAILVLIFIFGFVIGLFIGWVLPKENKESQVNSKEEKAKVIKVIDGDTVVIEGGESVRYLGIDAPEQSEEYYREATEFNRKLVEGKVVELEKGIRDRDEYGRLLRYVFVDGVFVNAELISQGLARAYIFDSSERYSQILVQLEQYAKLKNRGLWKISKNRTEYKKATEQ
jgi:micrococcal nuclease